MINIIIAVTITEEPTFILKKEKIASNNNLYTAGMVLHIMQHPIHLQKYCMILMKTLRKKMI